MPGHRRWWHDPRDDDLEEYHFKYSATHHHRRAGYLWRTCTVFGAGDCTGASASFEPLHVDLLSKAIDPIKSRRVANSQGMDVRSCALASSFFSKEPQALQCHAEASRGSPSQIDIEYSCGFLGQAESTDCRKKLQLRGITESEAPSPIKEIRGLPESVFPIRPVNHREYELHTTFF